jgi:hypothetical protein
MHALHVQKTGGDPSCSNCHHIMLAIELSSSASAAMHARLLRQLDIGIKIRLMICCAETGYPATAFSRQPPFSNDQHIHNAGCHPIDSCLFRSLCTFARQSQPTRTHPLPCCILKPHTADTNCILQGTCTCQQHADINTVYASCLVICSRCSNSSTWMHAGTG